LPAGRYLSRPAASIEDADGVCLVSELARPRLRRPFDRLIKNLRRSLGYDVQYFAAIEPQRRLARTSMSHSAAPSPAPACRVMAVT
jgi:hypothetical protein